MNGIRSTKNRLINFDRILQLVLFRGCTLSKILNYYFYSMHFIPQHNYILCEPHRNGVVCYLTTVFVFCCVSARLSSYEVLVITGDVSGAGTNANVYIVMFGDKGETGQFCIYSLYFCVLHEKKRFIILEMGH